MSVTKFALLAQKRGIWAVLPVQGEFCTGVGVGTLSRERFVPGLVSREEGGTKCVSSLPDWRPGTACEIGGEVSDQLWRGSWASKSSTPKRLMGVGPALAWAVGLAAAVVGGPAPGIDTHPDRSCLNPMIDGDELAPTRIRIGNEHRDR